MNTPAKRPNSTNLQPPLDTNVPFMDDNHTAFKETVRPKRWMETLGTLSRSGPIVGI